MNIPKANTTSGDFWSYLFHVYYVEQRNPYKYYSDKFAQEHGWNPDMAFAELSEWLKFTGINDKYVNNNN